MSLPVCNDGVVVITVVSFIVHCCVENGINECVEDGRVKVSQRCMIAMRVVMYDWIVGPSDPMKLVVRQFFDL